MGVVCGTRCLCWFICELGLHGVKRLRVGCCCCGFLSFVFGLFFFLVHLFVFTIQLKLGPVVVQYLVTN